MRATQKLVKKLFGIPEHEQIPTRVIVIICAIIATAFALARFVKGA